MAVTSCSILYDLAGNASFKANEPGTYKIKYQVLTDGAMGPIAIVNQAATASPHNLPAMWSTYSYQNDTDTDSYMQSAEVEQDPNSVLRYIVTLTWSPPNAVDSDGNPPTEPNPLLRPPVFWWDREVFNEIVESGRPDDAAENAPKVPFKNLTAEMYDQPIELHRSRGVLVSEINVADLDTVAYFSRTFDSTVNSQPWAIGGRLLVPIPKRCACVREISAGPARVDNGFSYYTMSFRIALDRNTFDVPMVERGFYYWKKDLNGAYIMEAADFDGGVRRRRFSFGSAPGGLRADGTRINNELDDNGNSEQPHVTRWRLYDEVDFNSLPF